MYSNKLNFRIVFIAVDRGIALGRMQILASAQIIIDSWSVRMRF